MRRRVRSDKRTGRGKDVEMPQEVIVYRIFIASPSDVQKEREEAKHAIDHWNDLYSQKEGIMLKSVLWETQVSPQMGDEPQAIIDRDALADCDVLIGIFWTRLGTPTLNACSGTVEEIEIARGEGKEILLFFSSAKERPPDFDQQQYESLMAVKREYQQAGFIGDYKSLDDFKNKVSDAIYRAIERIRKRSNWIVDYQHRHEGQLPALPDYLEEAVLGYSSGQPISKSMKVRPVGAQHWNRLSHSQRGELRQLVEWLGQDWKDYWQRAMKLWPSKVPYRPVKRRPRAQ